MRADNLYFIAIIPKRELRYKIHLLKEDFAARFNSRKALKVYPHITLKSPMKCPAEEHDNLLSWFKTSIIDETSFAIELKDFGAFHNKSNPVVFVNPVESKALRLLQKQIVSSLKSLMPQYITPVDEHFHPHMTIAYRDLSPDNFEQAWLEYRDKKFSDIFEIDAVHLLQHDTRKWNIIATRNLF